MKSALCFTVVILTLTLFPSMGFCAGPIMDGTVTKSKMSASPNRSLQDTIRIRPGDIEEGKPVKNKLPSIDPLDFAYADFKRTVQEYSNLFMAFMQRCDYCQERAYSVQDQVAAGCQADEHVGDCRVKCFRWCKRDAAAAFNHKRIQMAQKLSTLKSKLDTYYKDYSRRH